MFNNLNQQLDLNQLRKRVREKPRTKAGQVRQAWPDIRDLLAAGHCLKDVWTWLNEIGLEIYARLSDYVGQLRRQEEARLEIRERQVKPSESVTRAFTPGRSTVRTQAPVDDRAMKGHPRANLLERERNRPGFHYNDNPDPKKLI
jgi:hypothetical protein